MPVRPFHPAPPYLRLLYDGHLVLVHYLRRPRSSRELGRLADLADEFAAGALSVEPCAGRVAIAALNERAETLLGARETAMSIAEWHLRSAVDHRSGYERLLDAFVSTPANTRP